MKNQKINFTKELAKVMNLKKVEPKAVLALQSSLNRGKSLIK